MLKKKKLASEQKPQLKSENLSQIISLGICPFFTLSEHILTYCQIARGLFSS